MPSQGVEPVVGVEPTTCCLRNVNSSLSAQLFWLLEGKFFARDEASAQCFHP